jgi:predicted RND superfamily exporter protein
MLKKNEDSKITNFWKFFSKLSNTYFYYYSFSYWIKCIGISKLEVENSFINYFSKKTEIYKGMKLIDEELGGTTPLEVILKFPEIKKKKMKKMMILKIGDEKNEQDDEKYWFTKDKIDTIANVHNYLDNLPQIGKVLSFSSIIDVATQLNNNKPLGTLEMGVLYTKIPETIKTEIIDPYISIKDNEARISLRIIDSQEN